MAMNGKAVWHIRERRLMTKYDLANALLVSAQTIYLWEKRGSKPIPKKAELKLREFEKQNPPLIRFGKPYPFHWG